MTQTFQRPVHRFSPQAPRHKVARYLPLHQLQPFQPLLLQHPACQARLFQVLLRVHQHLKVPKPPKSLRPREQLHQKTKQPQVQPVKQKKTAKVSDLNK